MPSNAGKKVFIVSAAAAFAVFLISGFLFADELILKDGTVVRGTIEKETPERVIIKTDGGEKVFEKSGVLDIRRTPSPEEEYAKRAANLDNAAAAHAELGEWCRENKMHERSKKHFEEALKLDPENSAARRGLGCEKVGGRWLSGDELQIAKGNVKFEEKWIKKSEAAEILAARRQEAAEYLRTSKMPAGSACLRSRHFFILSNAAAPDLDNLLTALEGLRDAYYRLFETEGGLKLVECDDMAVCVFTDRDAYETYARLLKVKIGEMTYGYYASTEQKALVFRNPSNPGTMEMMLHESSHMLFTRAALRLSEWEEGGRLSAWFYEGLAEYFEGAYFENGALVTDRPHSGDLKRAQDAFISNSAMGLAELAGAAALTDLCNSAALNTPRINLAYAESWALVYYLIHGEDGKYRKDFFRFFDRERRGKGGSLSAFKKIFGDPSAMEEKWRKFIMECK